MGNLFTTKTYKPENKKKCANKKTEGANDKLNFAATKEELAAVLHCRDVDFLIDTNTVAHHTDQYECTKDRDEDVGFGTEATLVVRRGQIFDVKIEFDREFSLEKDDLCIEVKTGKSRYAGNPPEGYLNTFSRFMIDESGELKCKSDRWGGKLLKKEGNTATIQIHIAANCAIGRWTLTVITKSKVEGESQPVAYLCDDPEEFIILFNPWCPDDTVYMADDDALEEYILNDQGAVFKGQGHCPRGKAWNMGQFEDGIVDICIALIEKCVKEKGRRKMGNAIKVARCIAQIVNCSDDDGVLWGNWSGDYSDGESPSNWFGSPRILQKYWETKKPVKYGQCWVFSGVVVTVCRALGIPCRSVTNYSSAHDHDENALIEKLYIRDKDGELDYDGGDSVWNFHVWDEVWLIRIDLPEHKGKYDGWQIIDATPQEKSKDGLYVLGPAPQLAVKEGQVSIPYDTLFTFSEVNADEVCLEKIGNQRKKIKLRTDNVGKKISTKKPDGKKFDPKAYWDNRLDLTNDYKYPEGSTQERNAVYRAAVQCKNVSEFYTGEAEEKEDVEFELLHSETKKILGKDVDVRLSVKNVSEYRKTLTNIRFRFVTMKYTGVLGKLIKPVQMDLNEELRPGKVYDYPCKLAVSEYLSELDDNLSLCIQAFATVEKTRTRPMQNCIKVHECTFVDPDIHVDMADSVDAGDEFEACLTFENPLDVELTDCSAGYEGRGFKHVTGVKQDNVPPHGKGEARFKLKSKVKGKYKLVFKFNSKELQYLSGTGEINVK